MLGLQALSADISETDRESSTKIAVCFLELAEIAWKLGSEATRKLGWEAARKLGWEAARKLGWKAARKFSLQRVCTLRSCYKRPRFGTVWCDNPF